MKKPTIIEISKWEKEYYTLRMPLQTKEEFLKLKARQWYKEQYYKNNK